MEYFLSVTSEIEAQGLKLRSPVTSVRIEADLNQYATSGSPDFFFGKLLDVTLEQLARFKFESGVEVAFRRQRYRFEELERSGTFKLRRN